MVPLTPPTARDEAARLSALVSLQMLDGEPEREFDALVRLTSRLLDCPTAMLSLVDRDRVWIKARSGAGNDETPRHGKFCDTTIRTPEFLVVEDASLDTRFNTLSVVTGDAHMRFYAGAPIHVRDGEGVSHAIGALCVTDTTPRTLTAGQRQALAELATLAEALIAARQTTNEAIRLAHESEGQAIRLVRQERVLLQAERMAMIGSWRLVIGSDRPEWSDNVYRIYGLPVGCQPRVEEALQFYPPASRPSVEQALARLAGGEDTVEVETDFITADGQPRRVRWIGELEYADGRPIAMIGIFQDVTEQYTLQQVLRRTADADPLTGIANRAAFDRTLGETMARVTTDATPLMLALIDLDGFKAVNDTLGHLAGDDVLKAIARRLHEPWLHHSFAARLGGDEFALIVEDPRLCADPVTFAARLQDTLRVPVSADALTIACGGTVGTATFGADIRSIRDFVGRADASLYAAKRGRIGQRHLRARRAIP